MATTLRRRAHRSETSESPVPDPTPPDESLDRHPVRVVHRHPRKGRKRWYTAAVSLGICIGVFGEALVAQRNNLIDFPDIGELSVDSLFEALPASLIRDFTDIVVSASRQWVFQAASTNKPRF